MQEMSENIPHIAFLGAEDGKRAKCPSRRYKESWCLLIGSALQLSIEAVKCSYMGVRIPGWNSNQAHWAAAYRVWAELQPE